MYVRYTRAACRLAPQWQLDLGGGAKWINPAMGWTASADALGTTAAPSSLRFATAEEAEGFCRRMGWRYEVQQPNWERKQRMKRYRGYGDNFTYIKKGRRSALSVPVLITAGRREYGVHPQSPHYSAADARSPPTTDGLDAHALLLLTHTTGLPDLSHLPSEQDAATGASGGGSESESEGGSTLSASAEGDAAAAAAAAPGSSASDEYAGPPGRRRPSAARDDQPERA